MKAKRFVSILILMSLVLVLSFAITGCRKQSQATGQKWTCPMHPEVISEKSGECPKCKMKLVPIEGEKDANTMGAAMPADIEQKMCPVMANMPINKDIFVEYQGKKVYFCCNDCKAKFEKEPEKYLSKLPQFSK